jgi:hypothetical protein
MRARDTEAGSARAAQRKRPIAFGSPPRGLMILPEGIYSIPRASVRGISNPFGVFCFGSSCLSSLIHGEVIPWC